MGLNFVGETWATQFLIATLLRDTEQKNPGAMQEILQLIAHDFYYLLHAGVTSEDGSMQIFFCHLACKGDLPALKKAAGGVKRSFSNIPRGSSSKKPCGGICHQCLAGQEYNPALGLQAYPYEDLSSRPCWEETIEQVKPWDSEPVLLDGVALDPGRKASFFAYDLWHSFHLGVCKHFVASSLVVVIESKLPALEGHRSVEAKLSWISGRYKEFCKNSRLAMWVSEIDREALSWPQSSATPIGRWNKGSCSTTMMLFLGDFCEQYIQGHTADEQLLLIATWLQVEVFNICFVYGGWLHDVCPAWCFDPRRRPLRRSTELSPTSMVLAFGCQAPGLNWLHPASSRSLTATSAWHVSR